MRLPKIIILILMTMVPSLIFGQSLQEKEISDLKTKIITLSTNFQATISNSELKNNNMIARYQAHLLIKVFTYEIVLKLKRMGVKRNKDDIEKAVRAAFDNSWIFQDLGIDHADRFTLILQWACDESHFDKSCISSWRAGQYIRKLKTTIRKDTTDYGEWQNNEDNLQFLKLLKYLYESGVIRFKINKIRTTKDLMDITTSCTARCLIETDRKNRGWEWRHIGDKNFNAWLHSTLSKLEHEGAYNRAFVEKYYNVTPYKKYSYAKTHK